MNGHFHIELAHIRRQQLLADADTRRLARMVRRGRRESRRAADETNRRAAG